MDNSTGSMTRGRMLQFVTECMNIINNQMYKTVYKNITVLFLFF